MKYLVKLVVFICLIAVVSGCNRTFRSQVSRFHELPKPTGERVVIVPKDKELNSSIEFASYASMVGEYLGKYGYIPAGGGKADLIVELDFQVEEKRPYGSNSLSLSYGNGFWGGGYWGFGYPYIPVYGYHHYRHHSFWPYYGRSPYYNSFGFRSRFGYGIRNMERYTRTFSMVIRPVEEGAKNLFEGQVENTGRKKRLKDVMPLMVQAMFSEFPGDSGSSVRVVINLDEMLAEK